MSLYRKYRPKNFGEVIGQENVVQTLRGAIESGGFGHAYIFAGNRGTGKTSIARIFARALNCLSLNGSEPCGECANCRAIDEGRFLDLIEIDAASNRGIDDIRDLREKIRFSPSQGKYKIYIIDEVHMLTNEAFNALLKTLEEPPAHAMFIFATTELHKIPLTIISRCQRLDFGKIEKQKIIDGVKRIAEKESIKINDQAAKKIMIIAEGSLRDALSILDQLSSFVGGEEITVDLIENVFGYSKEEKLIGFLKLVKESDKEGIVSFVNGTINDGKDIENFIKELLRFLRQVLVFKTDSSTSIDFINPKDAEDVCSSFSFDQVVMMIDLFSEILKESKNAFIPQMILEVKLINFINRDGSKQNLAPLQKQASSNEPKVVITEKKELVKESHISESIGEDNKEIKKEKNPGRLWNDCLEKIREQKVMSLYTALQNSDIQELEDRLNIMAFNDFYFNTISKKENLALVESVLYGLSCFKKVFIKKGIQGDALLERDVVKDALSVFGGEILE